MPPGSGGYEYFCCGGSGRRWPDRPARRASDSVPSSLSAPRGSSLPEGAQIAGDLRRTLGRRQQLQHQRHPPLGDHRRRGLAEHLLHTHRQRWRVLRMVSDRPGGCRSARYSASAARDPASGAAAMAASPVAPDADPAPSAPAGNERRSSAAAAMSPARPAAKRHPLRAMPLPAATAPHSAAAGAAAQPLASS